MGNTWRIFSLLTGLTLATSLALAGATWQGQPYNLTVPPHVTASGGAVSGSVGLTLDRDIACTLIISATGGGSEVLTRGGRTLTTYYKLTGTALGDGDPAGDQPNDAGWLDSTSFLARQYHTVGSSTEVILCVKGVAPSDHAIDAGDYSASITLTATW